MAGVAETSARRLFPRPQPCPDLQPSLAFSVRNVPFSIAHLVCGLGSHYTGQSPEHVVTNLPAKCELMPLHY